MNMKKIFVAMTLILAVGLMAFSCKPGTIDGKWIIRTVNGEAVQTAEKTPYITFNEAEGRINACFGVNTANGSYRFEDGKLSIDNLMMTMMAGLPKDMEVENKVREAVGNVASAKVSGDKLSLFNAAGTEVLTLVREK